MFPLLILIFMVTIALVCGPIDNCIEKQYMHKGICCPMCNPGHRVQRHCENDSGTTCHPCDTDTYQNSVNGNEKCIPCSTCEEGMYPLNPCTKTWDTACDCSEGFHCLNITTTGCEKCTKHSTCKPGEKTARKGSYRKDTVCLPSAGSNVLEEMPTKPPNAGTNGDANGRTEPTPGGYSAEHTAIIFLSVIICILFLLLLKRPDICRPAIGACSKQCTRKSAEAGLQIPVQEEIRQDVAVSVEEVSPLTHPRPIYDIADGKLQISATLSEKGVRQLKDSKETVNLSSVKVIDDGAEETDVFLQ